MKKLCTYVFLSALCLQKATAQNTFPSSGRTGIYTTSPATSLHVNGGARIGKGSNYVNIDSATGNLSFNGNAAYLVAANKYAFQYAAAPNYGLFFNAAAVQYEFRNGSAIPVFYVGANTGNGIFTGTLKVGAYTLPSADGSNGQVLKTNGSGTLTWSADNGASYVAGSGISILGNTIANTAPSQWGGAANIYYNGGSVGIGTTTPVTKLQVSGGDATINEVTIGRGGGSQLTNLASGYQALASNTTGSYNTASGAYAMQLNTTGKFNVANGTFALNSNISGASNTATGYYALGVNTTGGYNTASGYFALTSNTTGFENTATGANALLSNTTGAYNTSSGANAMYYNTTGSSNAVAGSFSMYNNITGSGNATAGTSALYYNNSGSNNTAIGFGSMFYNTSGYSNVAVGMSALYNSVAAHNVVAIGDSALYNQTASNTGGFGLTALGSKTLFSNTTGTDNTALGSYSLYTNTSGFNNTALGAGALQLNNTGYYNTATGFATLRANTSGYFNTANGVYALNNNTTGYANTAVGEYSQPLTTIGWQNTSVGTYSLVNNTNGSYNTAVGYNTGNNGSSNNNTTCIGIDATATGSNMVRLGNTFVTSIGGQVGWTTLSDGRFKESIKENVPGLSFINLLRPVTYKINRNKVDGFTGVAARAKEQAQKDPNFKPLKGELYTQTTTGFIAQEVEQAAQKIDYDFSGVDAPKNSNDMYGLRYDEFVVPLVKAVQELSRKNDDLQQQINELKQLVQSQPAIEDNQVINAELNGTGTIAKIDQNIPNPFNSTTTINYYLPAGNNNAAIHFYSAAGLLLKSVKLETGGKGSIHLKATEMPSGIYRYALIVNGTAVESRQMMIAK